MFSLDTLLQDAFPDRAPPAWQRKLLRSLLFEKEFKQFAEDYPHLKGLDLIEQVVENFNISCELVEGDLENIPSQGPVMLVANHPIGSLDGLALLRTVATIRPDVKVVANQLLSYIEPLSHLFVPVDNLNNRTSRKQIEAMQTHLERQGALILFPAGEVSRLTAKGIRDSHWHTGFLRLAAKARAPIVPIHISGRNSHLFYMTSFIYRPLSTLLLVREMFKHQGGRIKIRIGGRIPFAHWHDGHTRAHDLAERFRRHVYLLGQGKSGLFTSEAPIALPEDRLELKKALMACERLGTAPDGKAIFLYRRKNEARAPILRELGRLREIAFRAVGEGSGRRRDLDSYDDDYYHLVLWDEEELEIVGAYRFIPTSEQLTNKGIESIYSYTLFHYDQEMRPILEQGIELGRSFIQPAYWGKRGLDYLWLGIGAYLAKYPQYRYLFGPVSMSGTMPIAARDLLIAFYRLYFSPEHAMAQSRQPYPASLPQVLAQFSGDNYQDDLIRLKSLLSNIGSSIPTLYKQYTELCEPGGVQFIDFGTDPAFNNCIDGLVLVDLTKLKPTRYQRYVAVHLGNESKEAET
ncbi:lysophospholipid acyltransferase family protein [Providencia stuartii]|uniref:L-ornithine N(alpha)-acyltransferase n=3 Tax=Enterobacterales TaxID=91347 RepID=A0A1S1HVT6_PROST|nr:MULTISPECIES: GNAT family N-acyltransferase [Providencia]ELR5041481.1 lysophospholipid acyltransferase family protein [Providencia stuartii]ELR5083585.1 lysophospholipid acyltransferase family protein [Providencia stuartii]ELR5112354.1 lysophospholipid acyltransferase family protein [Providencia stuartii]ELR5299268.1 lysophospholipid acyltransferase family protein [Providencia stuartii]MDW7590921.1 GNAT family N-acyltransferase [Providencia sp. 2023EL-00965]